MENKCITFCSKRANPANFGSQSQPIRLEDESHLEHLTTKIIYINLFEVGTKTRPHAYGYFSKCNVDLHLQTNTKKYMSTRQPPQNNHDGLQQAICNTRIMYLAFSFCCLWEGTLQVHIATFFSFIRVPTVMKFLEKF